jgi:transposase
MLWSALFPEQLEDYLGEHNPVRAIDVFDELDLAAFSFGDVEPEATGRPAYHPATLLKIYATDTSIECSRAGVGSGSASATSSWFG